MADHRIRYLDGLRGILAIIVFIHHFLFAFCPELVFGGDLESFKSGAWTFSRLFALTPLNLVFNPGAAINFFFLLSGYVQSLHYFQTNDLPAVKRSLVKRYFRLALPTLSVVLLVFIFHRLQLIDRTGIPDNRLTSGWVSRMMPDNLNFLQTFRYGLLDCFLGKAQSYQVLWTMPIELFNSWMVLILLMVTHRFKNKLLFYLIWLSIQFILLESYYGISFTLGLTLAWLNTHSVHFREITSSKVLKYFCLITGLYFASFPYTGYETSSRESIYAPISFFDHIPSMISYAFGNVLLFFFLLQAPRLQTLLARKELLFFGDISFMFYLLHFLILFSFSPWVFVLLSPQFPPGPVNCMITALLSFFLITGLSWLFYHLIDRRVIQLCNTYSKRLFRVSPGEEAASGH